jgi:hypothetical protein
MTIVYQIPDRFLVSGCSFTTGSSDAGDIHKKMNSWPCPLVVKYNIPIIYNLALSGGGNTSICHNISYVIDTDPVFAPENTLVLFNITGLDRIDLMVQSDHPDINTNGSWHKVFPFAWITSGGWLTGKLKKITDTLQKNLGWDSVIRSNCLNIINFIQRLEADGYRYYFMLMDDQILDDAPDFFINFIKSKTQQWITFNEYLSMHSYGKSLGLLESDNFHLTLEGNLKIAEIVNNQITKEFNLV